MATLTSTRIKIISVLLIASIVAGALALYVFTIVDNIVHGDLYNYSLRFDIVWASLYWDHAHQFLGSMAAAIVLMAVSAVLFLRFARGKNASLTIFGFILPLVMIGLSVFSILNFAGILQIVYVTLLKDYGLRPNIGWGLPLQAYSILLYALIGISIAAISAIPFLFRYSAREIVVTEKPGLIRIKEKTTKTQSVKLASFALATAGTAAILASLFIVVQSQPLIATVQTAQILAFIGLGLIFWSILFIYIRPEEYTKKTLLSAIDYPEIATLNQIINELNFKGNPLYLPPKYFTNPKTKKVFIPEQNETKVPTPNQIRSQESQMFINTPTGILLTPPGSDLTELFEKTLGANFANENLRDLQKTLPKIITEDLSIARSFEMEIESDKIQVSVEDSVYNMPNPEKIPQGLAFGSVLGSAIGCALAKTTGNPVKIERQQTSSDGKNVIIQYRIVDEEAQSKS